MPDNHAARNDQNTRTMRRTLTTAYSGLVAFTLISILVPVIWERLSRRRERNP